MMIKHLLFLLLVTSTNISLGQPPPGYYATAVGLDHEPLKTALHEVIKNHTEITYAQIWTAFQTTDKKANGKVWDIYSDIPNGTPPYEFTFVTQQCGNYNSENDCYNREHSWPKSYFNDASPMYSDLFHIYATDGYVNNKRNNFPYGEVDTVAAFWQSLNGSRLGVNRFPGYSGTVFEPLNEYKGDLARTYFYMATRYFNEDSTWNSWAMATGADLTPWAVSMLLKWSHEDPVSQKETDRNNEIYAIQHNRNPFIDHPEFIDCIWDMAGCDTPLPIPVATNEITKELAYKVFPNPASDQIWIKDLDRNVKNSIEVDIINVQGRIIYHRDKTMQNTPFEIPVSQYPRGLYWIKIRTDKDISVRKIILQ